ncbi:type II toxin-antitoxin system RelE/ParE family toxin [Kaistella jeonii]|uniref:Plasmid stabilization protein n=1 Tax=Kaistella jeonii TaxID=266749 RepID=A0A0C1CYP7_9FLAO|nr:type II toxin-antitoxin system RelE/ParE family toxin [Kaistella jeonii]KIA89556.1 hypothetical protein OA86_02660 [Kaistella jeonii]SFB91097.1 ParE toxin of type II toxin-antitoxin system, parDE [Kaistella jeonii]VEI95758.1 Plasmid stabilisation system protein [Kaistella jeonii]
MKSGYNILWTEYALEELEKTIEYLEINFTEKEIKKLAKKTETVLELISINPLIFPKSENKEIYKVVILKINTLYYRITGNDVEILSFFSNRQNPKEENL